MASNQIPHSALSGIYIYTYPGFILLFWLRFWLRFGHGFGHDCLCTSIITDRTPKGPKPLYLLCSIAACHSYSFLVSSVLGETSDPRVGGSSPSGRTNLMP